LTKKIIIVILNSMSGANSIWTPKKKNLNKI